MVPPDANRKVVYGGYLVAVFDILGTKDAIRRLAEFRPGIEDNPQIIQSLKDSIGARDAVFNGIKSSLEAYACKPDSPPAAVLSAEEQATYDSIHDCRIITYSFSDTLVAYSPMVTAQGNPPLADIFGMLTACAAAMLTAIALGKPIRGAVEIGFGLGRGSKEIYGPALLTAYELQENVAQYPRIVVGHALASYLHSVRQVSPTSFKDKVLTDLTEMCLRLIAQDEDGCLFVDYLGDQYRQILESTQPDEPLVEKGLAFAQREHARFIQENNPKLAGRYAALRRYFENGIPAWRKQK